VSLSATVRALVLAGATPEMILAVVETHERETASALERRRASDAARQQAHRDRKAVTVEPASRDITLPANEICDSRDPSPHVGECAQVVTPSLPSLRSEEVKPVSPDGDTRPLTPKFAKPNGFARFWEAYPNKVGKAAAEAAYAKALKRISGPDPPSVLLAGVERAKASRAWGEGFIPHPKTWLSQGRWDDEPAEVIPLKASHERPHPDAKFAARQANLATLERGADLAARLHRQP
jgi:hypothetical protein